MTHDNKHPLAGKTVELINPRTKENIGTQYRITDWWDSLGQGSWMEGAGNFACLKYAMRAGSEGLPVDDEVVYGKIGSFGHLIHVSELGEIAIDAPVR